MTFGNVAFQYASHSSFFLNVLFYRKYLTQTFRIDVRDLIFQPITDDLRGNCVSSLSAGTIKNGDTWLLGDSFLKNVYMTTNVDDKTVQLSARTKAPGSSSLE